jgi:(4S)-4-hydroxy-5-phosphonooxypentane-2,3-dione isomerase
VISFLRSIVTLGVSRFDLFRRIEEDPNAPSSNEFLLIEVYRNADVAPQSHKGTSHYQVWRDKVAESMAAPRQAATYHGTFSKIAA